LIADTIFDGLIVASALSLGCRRLWPEDMQHGLLVEGTLRIENPYRV
jgi:predicted nucleic acid-binding protein